MGYRTREEVEAWMANCPVKRWEDRLLAGNFTTEDDLAAIRKKIEAEVTRDMAAARADPFPEESQLYTDVY